MITQCPLCSLYWKASELKQVGKIKICRLCALKLKIKPFHEEDEVQNG